MRINKTSVKIQKYDSCYSVSHEKQVSFSTNRYGASCDCRKPPRWCTLWLYVCGFFTRLSALLPSFGEPNTMETPWGNFMKELPGIQSSKVKWHHSCDLTKQVLAMIAKEVLHSHGGFFLLKCLPPSLLLWNITHIFSFTTTSMCEALQSGTGWLIMLLESCLITRRILRVRHGEQT